MKTVKEVSAFTGVSVRTLHHYDAIGLLKPDAVTEAGYRLYGDTALARLQQILLFRELEFPLKEIKEILGSPDFDRDKALTQQITLLTMKKQHLENLIELAREIKTTGVSNMDFTPFDTSKMDEYAARAKAAYGKTSAYKEFTEKTKNCTGEEMQHMGMQMMEIFAEFGAMRESAPESDKVQAQVQKLQDFITEHYYTCTDEILAGLGAMYIADAEFSANIDKAAGAGTAAFVSRAIEVYCRR